MSTIVQGVRSQTIVQQREGNVVVRDARTATIVPQYAGDSVVVEQDGNLVTHTTRSNTLQMQQGSRGKDGQPGRDGAGQIPPITFGWGDAPRMVYVPDAPGILTVARIQYTQVFNDPAATVSVGTADEPAALLPPEWNNPGSLLEFENTPDLALAAGEGVLLTINPGASSQGAGLLFLTFLPTT